MTQGKGKGERKDAEKELTTMPISFLSLPFISTVLSNTRFMNWSKPRKTPTTTRLALSLTAPRQQTARTPIKLTALNRAETQILNVHKKKSTEQFQRQTLYKIDGSPNPGTHCSASCPYTWQESTTTTPYQPRRQMIKKQSGNRSIHSKCKVHRIIIQIQRKHLMEHRERVIEQRAKQCRVH